MQNVKQQIYIMQSAAFQTEGPPEYSKESSL